MFARNGEHRGPKPVTAITTFAGRLRWHVRALGVNPLVRFTDRLEALAAFALLLATLVAIPFAVQSGDLVYSSTVRTAHEQTHTRHPVAAVAIDGTSLMTDFDGAAYVTAQWHAGGQVRTAQVIKRGVVTAGDPITVWLDDKSGKPVAAPQTPADARVTAIAAAAMVWTLLVVLSALAAFALRKGLDRLRANAWERELQLLAHNDDGWANRHT